MSLQWPLHNNIKALQAIVQLYVYCLPPDKCDAIPSVEV